MKKIAFIIDSSSGITTKELKQYNDTFFMPMLLNFDSKIEIDDDENHIKFEEFYKKLKYHIVKTSQISIGKMLNTWNKLLKSYDSIIFIGISKGLSSQHQCFSILANQKKYKNKVYVIDTDGVSQLNIQYFIYIFNLINNKNIALHKIQTKINKLKKKFSAFIIPKNLKYLKRGGRITSTHAILSSIFKITPILRYNGKIEKFYTTQTSEKAIKIALNQIKKERKNWKNIILVYSKISEKYLNNVKKIIQNFGSNIINTYILSNVVAAHTGPNTIVLICWDNII